MLISVIIPVYNVSRYLRQCVDRVLGQTYQDMQVILVDDGSTDQSGAMCDEYAQRDSRVQVIHKQNGGLSDARNVGTQCATGEYLLYLDSDDMWGSEAFVERLVRQVGRERKDVVLFELVRFSDEIENIQPHGIYCDEDFGGSPSEIMYRLVRKNEFSMSACQKMIKTSVLKDNKVEFSKGLFGEDMDWVLRFWQCVKSVGFNNDVCYQYRVRQGSISTTFRLKNAEDFAWTLETWKSYWENSQNPNSRLYLGYLSYLYVTLVYRYMDIAAADREKIFGRIVALAPLLQYSITNKSDRLLKLQRLVGTKLMIHISSSIQHFRTNVR